MSSSINKLGESLSSLQVDDEHESKAPETSSRPRSISMQTQRSNSTRSARSVRFADEIESSSQNNEDMNGPSISPITVSGKEGELPSISILIDADDQRIDQLLGKPISSAAQERLFQSKSSPVRSPDSESNFSRDSDEARSTSTHHNGPHFFPNLSFHQNENAVSDEEDLSEDEVELPSISFQVTEMSPDNIEHRIPREWQQMIAEGESQSGLGTELAKSKILRQIDEEEIHDLQNQNQALQTTMKVEKVKHRITEKFQNKQLEELKKNTNDDRQTEIALHRENARLETTVKWQNEKIKQLEQENRQLRQSNLQLERQRQKDQHSRWKNLAATQRLEIQRLQLELKKLQKNQKSNSNNDNS